MATKFDGKLRQTLDFPMSRPKPKDDAIVTARDND